MSKKRYVQHKSGIGEKWEVVESYNVNGEWCVMAKLGTYHYLPKTEYVLYIPPAEEWIEVTQECIVTAGVPEAGVGRTIFHYRDNEYIDVMHARHLHEYRLTHTGSAGDTLIIERKIS